jgi:rhodanese-related sulfurtransferase
MDFHQIALFLVSHWQLSGLFLVLLVMLVVEESRAQGGGQNIAPGVLVSLMNRDHAYVIDLRDVSAYGNGHILGAHNISKTDLPSHTNNLPKEDPTRVVLVCQRGQTAMGVFTQLKKQGFKNIAILKGGMDAWRKASMPVATTNKGKK